MRTLPLFNIAALASHRATGENRDQWPGEIVLASGLSFSQNHARARNGEEIVKRTTTPVKTIAVAVVAAGMGFAFLFAQSPAAQTTELRVLCSNGVKAAVEELRPQVERSVGRRLAIQFDSSQRLRQKIDAGEAFDVAILSSGAINELIQNGTIAAGSRAEIGRTGVGVGV